MSGNKKKKKIQNYKDCWLYTDASCTTNCGFKTETHLSWVLKDDKDKKYS